MKNKIILFLSIIFSVQFASAQNTKQKGDYGSLAIDSRNGDQYGWAINYTTQAEANNRALKECQENGGNNCHIVLNFKGGCAAYVVERGNPYLYGWGTADTRSEAENIAKEEARAQGGKNLVVRVWGCNDSKPVKSEELKPDIKGVYGFYFTKSDKDKKCFITGVYYQPGVAKNINNKWIWTTDAKNKMTDKAKKFLDAVEENLYGYLGDLKDKAITRKELDWKGINELEVTNDAMNLSNKERREKLENAINSIQESFKNQGYEIFEIDIN